MKKEYLLKFCHPQITIQEDSKEDFKKLMEWDEKKFMSMVFVRLKTDDEFVSPNKIFELIKACREGDSILWDEPNGEVYRIKIEKKYPKGWKPTGEDKK